jgi:hypothetical protein
LNDWNDVCFIFVKAAFLSDVIYVCMYLRMIHENGQNKWYKMLYIFLVVSPGHWVPIVSYKGAERYGKIIVNPGPMKSKNFTILILKSATEYMYYRKTKEQLNIDQTAVYVYIQFKSY